MPDIDLRIAVKPESLAHAADLIGPVSASAKAILLAEQPEHLLIERGSAPSYRAEVTVDPAAPVGFSATLVCSDPEALGRVLAPFRAAPLGDQDPAGPDPRGSAGAAG